MQKVVRGFSLRVNLSLLAAAIILAAVSNPADEETSGIICIIVGWVLVLVAVVPSSHGFVLERMTRGKARPVEDPNTIIPEWRQFHHSMGIESEIQMKVFGSLRSAQANGTTIEIGQPVLDNLDSVSIKAVFAHELAHIKINDARKLRHLLCLVLVGAVFVCIIHATVPWALTYTTYQLDFSWLTFSFFSILAIGLIGIAMRFRSWPDEYEADLMADQCVTQDAIASALSGLARLRSMDVTRDFYLHPSINKRKANLGWPRRRRFRQWYLAL
jgi:hypothetical protein